MKTWTISQARAQIASLFDATIEDGPQRVSRRDGEPVVMVAESDWNRLVAAFPDFADLVLDSPLDTEDFPKRRAARILDEGA